MEPIVVYYCVKGAVSIGKFALDYYKSQSLNDTNSELQNIIILNESIRDYIGLIRNDILNVMHLYFKSAYENLNYAIKSTSECKREYLIQARNRFIDACAIEKNDNLILSYLGLSLCQKLLGDLENSVITLNKIMAVEWLDIYGNDMHNVCKGWDRLWWQIIFQIQFESIRNYYSPYSRNKSPVSDIIDRELSWRYDSIEISYIKSVYLRRYDAIKRCGGFSLNEKEFSTTCINAEKLILKEDFYTLKQEIINSFQL